jgi:hypothetical protein
MTEYYKRIGNFDIRRYCGFSSVYIGMDKIEYNHIFGISDEGFLFTTSDLVSMFTILDESDVI